MLSTLALQLSEIPFEVVIAMDPRLGLPPLPDQLAQRIKIVDVDQVSSGSLFDFWANIASNCDFALIIAPETDGVLLEATRALRVHGIRLLNCSETLIDLASSKLKTANCLHAHGLSHPPTCKLHAADQPWRASVHEQATLSVENRIWIVKPDDGAGGQGIVALNDKQLDQLRATETQSSTQSSLQSWIVQPYVPGLPASCSAIADLHGRLHWLPPVSQDFAGGAGPLACDLSQYIGCTMPAAGIPAAPGIDWLDAAVAVLGGGALGWLSIDLVYLPERHAWTVIEINPRCTTSLVGLSRAYQGNLSAELFGAACGEAISIDVERFRATQFRVDTHRPLVHCQKSKRG